MNLSSIQLLAGSYNIITITISGKDKIQLYYYKLIEDLYYSYITPILIIQACRVCLIWIGTPQLRSFITSHWMYKP